MGQVSNLPADPWPAPTAPAPIDAAVSLPGSKSITNRALVLAAIADGRSTIDRPLVARDTTLMAAALRTLGVTIDDQPGAWHVTPPAAIRGSGTVDCGLAGTVMRFVPPVAVLADGPVRFDGDPHARKRPMDVVINALRDLGADISDDHTGTLPFTVHGEGRMPGGDVTIDAAASSQFVSCLLLSGARYEKGVTIHHDGKQIPSQPHIDMTVGMLREHGVAVDDSEANTWRIEPGPIAAKDRAIEPDLSNAAPFLAAALVTRGTVRVPGWPQATWQAGDVLRDLLSQFGANCDLDADGLTVNPGESLSGVDVDLHDTSELTPVVAALAALADGPSHIRGVAHIRGHETDRITALATEINNLGGDVVETNDGLEIRPRRLHGGVFHTYADHRMAQAGAVLGLAVAGVEVEDIATTSKTMPDFTQRWLAMLQQDQAA